MDYLQQFVDVILHLNDHLPGWANTLGPWLYVVLFAVVFCETGLVVTPFLPGDSLLFAVGTLLALDGSSLSMPVMLLVLIAAAILGDAVNYLIGYRVGPAVFRSEHSRLFNKKHLLRTQAFYDKYGGKTIVLARFIPIVRTFATIVAGAAGMDYRQFLFYNVAGGIGWVVSMCMLGYWLGATISDIDRYILPIVGVIIVVSVAPAIHHVLKERRSNREPLTVATAEAAELADR
jgi:membrane-associated protein